MVETAKNRATYDLNTRRRDRTEIAPPSAPHMPRSQPQPLPSGMRLSLPFRMTYTEYLYMTHALLELALGAIKLRGRYAHETPGSRSARSAMYVRHHGFSLLALALLGFCVLVNGDVHTLIGAYNSLAFFLFHGGACAAFSLAWADGAIPFRKVCVPHLPWAVGFAAHAWLQFRS